MRFSTLLIIGIVILGLINIVTAQSDVPHDLFNNEHYFIVGHIYEPYTCDDEVILINTRTGESLFVIAHDCEHGLKEYLFNLANLHQGWTHNDEFLLSYGNTTTQFSIIEGTVAYQQDIQRPDDVDPIYIFTSFLIVAVGGGYFYIRRKKKEYSEVTEMKEDTDNQKTGFKLFRDFGVRALIATLLVIGYVVTVAISVYLGNEEMITSITTIYAPVVMAVIVFYFRGSEIRDMK